MPFASTKISSIVAPVCIACATAKGTEVEAEGFAGEGVDRWEDAECVAVFFAVGF